MGLELVSEETVAATVTPPKQIAKVSSSSTSIFYTVPEGREFVGVVGASVTSRLINIDNLEISSWVPSTNAAQPVPVTFVAGTVIRGISSATCYIMGVERDAT